MPGVGLPANAPERPATAHAYPAVHDIPPPRTAATLTDLEQQKLERDLVDARDRQQAAVGIQPAEPRKEPKKKEAARQQPLVPVSSRQTIY